MGIKNTKCTLDNNECCVTSQCTCRKAYCHVQDLCKDEPICYACSLKDICTCPKHALCYKHKKTGNLYWKVGECINATNANDGQHMVLYRNADGMMFVREVNEFYEKFVIVSVATTTELGWADSTSCKP